MLLAASLLLLAPAPELQGPSVKDLFDGALLFLRQTQRQDGSYGDRLDTAYVVTAMALCPRAYREDDGPFVRDAVTWLIRNAKAEGDPLGDAATALALQTLHAERYASTIQELAQRAGVSFQSVEALAATGSHPQAGMPQGPGWDGLPIPAADQTAAGLLLAIPESAGIPIRAEAAARAGLAYRREKIASQAAPDAEARRQAMERGVDFLLRQRGESGLWEVFGQPEPGISALAARALLTSERAEVRDGAYPVLDFLKGLQKEDGSIHGGRLPVYVTSVSIMALAAGGREGDRQAIQRAADFLRAVQADGDEGYSESDKFYGGIGYGSDLRPDLSNLQYALQALHDSGAAADDPAYQRALVFLERSQNRSESNPGTFLDAGSETPVRAGNDGGAVYYPGNSPAGATEMPDGTLVARSYGSMTYALLKCYVFAGLELDDPRVQAAVDWVQRHWTLEVNPGFDTLRDPRAGYQGLYYYYLSLAEALRTVGLDEIVDPSGARHDWRAELTAKLLELQGRDGSWVNDLAERWWEGNPVLCTAYALAALHAAQE